jgi:soluble lytic murein transglycosylase-like protein
MKLYKVLFLSLCFGLHAKQFAYLVEVQTACSFSKVPVHIVMGVILVESEGTALCASAYRKDGFRDEGIMQLNSKYLKEFATWYNRGKPINPFAPKEAIPVGVKILAYNYSVYGNWIEALAAYKQGVYGVQKNGVTHDSFHYIESVFSKGAMYRKEGE